MIQLIKVLTLSLLLTPTLFIIDTFTPSVQAQTIGQDPFKDVVKWKVTLDKKTPTKQGDIVTLRFEGIIEKGFHIFSTIPPLKPANLPTTIELDESNIGVVPQGNIQEEGKVIKVYDDVFETNLQYFKDKVVYEQKYKVTAEKCLLVGNLKYQVCDENSKCVAQSHFFELKIIAP